MLVTRPFESGMATQIYSVPLPIHFRHIYPLVAALQPHLMQAHTALECMLLAQACLVQLSSLMTSAQHAVVEVMVVASGWLEGAML